MFFTRSNSSDNRMLVCPLTIEHHHRYSNLRWSSTANRMPIKRRSSHRSSFKCSFFSLSLHSLGCSQWTFYESIRTTFIPLKNIWLICSFQIQFSTFEWWNFCFAPILVTLNLEHFCKIRVQKNGRTLEKQFPKKIWRSLQKKIVGCIAHAQWNPSSGGFESKAAVKKR